MARLCSEAKRQLSANISETSNWVWSPPPHLINDRLSVPWETIIQVPGPYKTLNLDIGLVTINVAMSV